MTPTATFIDLQKIKQKKVRKFLTDKGITTTAQFPILIPVCTDTARLDTYHQHAKTFLIHRRLAEVWETYKTISPEEAWRGEMVSFGLQYNRAKDRVTYMHDPYEGMEKGQVIILNLRLFGGLFNLAVAHEVMEVNNEAHSLKLCYMKGGASEGSQHISLKETAEGFTEVFHLTYYKSGSNFRDTRIYPPLHTKAISEFHNNVKRKAESL
ncbi:MAG TPA: hypothetical protein VIU12_00715 [Chryseolinea sp.]